VRSPGCTALPVSHCRPARGFWYHARYHAGYSGSQLPKITQQAAHLYSGFHHVQRHTDGVAGTSADSSRHEILGRLQCRGREGRGLRRWDRPRNGTLATRWRASYTIRGWVSYKLPQRPVARVARRTSAPRRHHGRHMLQTGGGEEDHATGGAQLRFAGQDREAGGVRGGLKYLRFVHPYLLFVNKRAVTTR